MAQICNGLPAPLFWSGSTPLSHQRVHAWTPPPQPSKPFRPLVSRFFLTSDMSDWRTTAALSTLCDVLSTEPGQRASDTDGDPGARTRRARAESGVVPSAQGVSMVRIALEKCLCVVEVGTICLSSCGLVMLSLSLRKGIVRAQTAQ